MANPVMNVMQNNNSNEQNTYVLNGEPMTVSGSINKVFYLFALILLSSAYSWWLLTSGFIDKAMLLSTVGGIAGLILALIICFTRKALPVLTTLYSLFEGLVIGSVSAIFEAQYPGIVVQAVLATFAALFSMLVLYKTKLIQCTDKFRSTIFISTLSVMLIYLLDFIAAFFGHGIPAINGSGPIGITFSIVVCLIAAFNFIIDFEFIEQGERNFLPKQYEWFGAFGLMVTFIWLYIEMLKLLAKLSSRR